MAVHRMVSRPATIDLISWDGNNLPEALTYVPDAVVLPDGTLQIYPAGPIAQIGDFLHPSFGLIAQIACANVYQEIAITDLPAYVLLFDPIFAKRTVSVPIPATLLLAKRTIAVTWPIPMPNTAYDVTITPESSATLVGAVNWGVVAGTKTVYGCSISIQAVLGIAVNTVTLQVSAQST